MSRKKVNQDDYTKGFRQAVEQERPVYEAMLQSLTPQQIRLLSSLSEEPAKSPYSSEYMARFGLGSIGGIQGAIKKLIEMDYVEKEDGVYRIVDPVFGIWLRHLRE